MFIKVTNIAGETAFLNMDQVVVVNKKLGSVRTSNGSDIFITEESLEDVLDAIGYNYYGEED